MSWPERHLLAWIAPRGIVAAAISALFAIRLEQSGSVEAALQQKWSIRSTRLTESFSFEEYLRTNQARVIPLFALTPGGSLEIFTVEKQQDPQANWMLLGLVPPEEEGIFEPKIIANPTSMCSK